MRILCVISTMEPGGAQRAMARLVTHLAQRHEVTLVTWEAPEVASFYDLPPPVRLVRCGLLGGSGWAWVRRVAARLPTLRRHVRSWHPHVVLGFMDITNVTAVVACLGTGVPVVASERIDPARHRIPRAKSILRLVGYALADRVVVQTERVRRYFPRWMWGRIDIVPNAAPPPPEIARPDRPGAQGRFRIIGLGRLDRQKGFDCLIEAFGRIAGHHPAWDLVIFGEGSERKALEAQVAALGLNDRIRLPGVTRTPEAELAASHLMAFPSRFEGFPNALAEGIATGLPAVAFDGVSGVEDLVVPDHTGVLVDPCQDAAGFAAALDRLMADDAARARFGAAAISHAANWTPEAVHRSWERLLTEVAFQVRRPSSPCAGQTL
ncbi:MAG: glycosyltransferase family 4 protein [Magnetospirillum sp.]|nr:glycosyltransferase family 4 protein [Magnetospirillum sp.]